MQRLLTVILCFSVTILQGCRHVTESSISTIRSGNYQLLMRSQEFNHSGIRNVDVCVAEGADNVFPSDKRQCFLHGFDFSGLSARWTGQRNIELSFDCGRVDQFRNSAFIYGHGPAPEEFYVTLQDSCKPGTN